MKINSQLEGLAKCPHCSVANPNLNMVWDSRSYAKQGDQFYKKIIPAQGNAIVFWALYCCQTCGGMVCVEGGPFNSDYYSLVSAIYPEPKLANNDLPPMAQKFLQQAFDTLHSPDASAVMSGSAVDAMLKTKGYIEGSLYNRIDRAKEDHLLTEGMANWAHEVRLGSNRPRHADESRPHVSIEEAKQAVEFAEALGQFLFVLTAKMERAIAKAHELSSDTE